MHPRVFSMMAGLVVAGAIGTLLSAQSPATERQSSISFAKDIEPILESSCLSCHGDAVQLASWTCARATAR